MMMRSQVDPGVYGGFRGNRATLADVLGAVQGVQGIVSNARAMKKEEELNEDDKFLNETYARNFSGWDGRNPQDFQQRNQKTIMEIQQGRPKLYGKALGVSSTLEQAMQGRITSDLDIDKLITENETAAIDKKSKQMVFDSNMLLHNKNQQDLIGTQFALVAEGKQGFNDAVQHIKALGINANLPTEEQFQRNPGQYYDYLLKQKMQNEESMAALKKRQEELGIKKSEKELEWADRLNQALVGARNRQGTGGGIEGDITGLSEMDMINAQKLAREIAGVRGSKNILPYIIRARNSGMTFDNIRDEMRYSQQSGDFTGAAREGMQQLFAGKSGKAVDAAFDTFDDLLAKGDQKGMLNFLKRTAQNTAGQAEAAQVRGTERTIDFINEIGNDLARFEQNGGNTNIFSGTAENFAKKVGTVNNPEMRKIAEKIHAAIMKYRRSMSGAAFSVPESKEYADLFPSISRTGNLNTAAIQALQEVFSGDLRNFYTQSMGENAYNTFIGGGSFTQSPPVPSASERQNKARYRGSEDDLLNELFPE